MVLIPKAIASNPQRLKWIVRRQANAERKLNGYLEDYAALSRRQAFWITIGGPLASLLMTILCGALWLSVHGVDPWRGLAVIDLAGFLNSSIPWHFDSGGEFGMEFPMKSFNWINSSNTKDKNLV